jgi:hypothetical protein
VGSTVQVWGGAYSIDETRGGFKVCQKPLEVIMAKKFVLGLLIAAVMVGSAGAVDWKRGPDCVQPGSFLISGGLDVGEVAISVFSADMFGFTGSVDYALKRGLSVGGEIGYSRASELDMTASIIPIAARLGYHPNFGVRNLDVYGLFKLGVGFGSAEDESKTAVGVGIDLGCRYFFTDKIGAFAEVGFDEYDFDVLGIKVKAKKIFTIGLTYKM